MNDKRQKARIPATKLQHGCQPDTPSSLAAVAARWMGGKVSGRAGMLNFCRAGQLSGIWARMPIRARTAGQV